MWWLKRTAKPVRKQVQKSTPPMVEVLEGRMFLSSGTRVIFSDEFTGSRVSGKAWHRPAFLDGGTYYGETQQRTSENVKLPATKNGSADLLLSSYNPTQLPGLPSWYGTEFITNNAFKVNKGIDVLAKIRLTDPTRGGYVVAPFFYEVKPNGNHDEADIEILSGTPSRVGTNAYANEPLGSGTFKLAALPKGFDARDWHVYRIVIRPYQVEWYIDGSRVRIETGAVPAGPMHFHLNIWKPDPSFAQAYSSKIQSTENANENRDFHAFVDFVKIRALDSATPPKPVTPGVSITSVAPYGTSGFVRGTTFGIKNRNYDGVATYIYVDGRWWTKPYYDSPISSLEPNGSWSADIDTGGIDIYATQVKVFLIPKGFEVPIVGGESSLPDSLSSLRSAFVNR